MTNRQRIMELFVDEHTVLMPSDIKRELSRTSMDTIRTTLKRALAKKELIRIAYGQYAKKPTRPVPRTAYQRLKRELDDVRAFAQDMLSSYQSFASRADSYMDLELKKRAEQLGFRTDQWY